MAVCESLLLKLEYISRAQMHLASFYIVVVLGTLGIVTALAVASRHRWGCTILTGVYTAFGLAFLWILPLFPAEPKLGPVYTQVTHFIPWEFPLLLIVPAIVTDLILQRTATWRPLVRGPVAGSGLLRHVRRGAVAVRQLPDVAARPQLVLRHDLHGLRHAADVAVRALRVRAAAAAGAVLARHG